MAAFILLGILMMGAVWALENGINALKKRVARIEEKLRDCIDA